MGAKRGSREAEDERVFKALARKDRRTLLDLLREGPRSTKDLAAELPHLDRTTVLQHLGVLERVRLVIRKKRGRERWNYLDVAPIQRLHDRWIGAYAEPSARLLNRLRADLEGEPGDR